MKSKGIILVVIYFLFNANIKAQTNLYHPFPDTSAKWNESYWYQYSGPPISFVTCPNIVFLVGDTIISTLHYKKLFGSGYKYDPTPSNSCCYYYNTYQGAIRQDTINKKVYYRNNSSTSVDTLLYDFNLYVGDTLPKSYVNGASYPANYVSSIDSILIGTNYRKQYHISYRSSGGSDSNYVQLIEGIGSTFGLTYQITPPFESGSALYCFSQNNVTLYPNTPDSCYLVLGIKTINTQQTTMAIYPNPANSIINLTISQFDNLKMNSVEIFNMLGESVHHQILKSSNCQIDVSDLSEGVYFINLSTTEGVLTKKLVVQH